LPGADVQAIRQFVNQSPWGWAPVQRTLTELVVDALLPEAVLIIDETSFPKQGKKSVGVARQYCGALGKTANCQVAVSVHLGTEQSCMPLSWELYLPESWVTDSVRRKDAGVPAEITHRTKPELAIDLLDRVLMWGIGKRVVLADSGYGTSYEFRRALSERGLPYCVQVTVETKGWTEFPEAKAAPPTYHGKGRPRRKASPSELPEPVDLESLARGLPAKAWRSVTWREGVKGALRSRFARAKLWPSHKWLKSRTEVRALPSEPLDLLIEWPEGESKPAKYWLASLPEEILGMRRFIRLAKGRWRIEQDYRELKDELGLDHFEGRSWAGWHHHVTLSSMAYAFLVLETARGKKNTRHDATSRKT